MDDLGVVIRVSPAQRFRRRGGNAEDRRVEPLLSDRAVADHPHPRRGGGGELVEAVVTAEDQRRDATPGEDPGDDPGYPRVRDAHRLSARSRRVRQRSEEVERGRNAGSRRGTAA